MVDKLIVKDFGPIRHAEMDIKKATVLIGPQGSGKSTLAKLVALMVDKPNHGSEPELYNFNSESQRYGIAGYGKESTEIDYNSLKIKFNVKGNKFEFENRDLMLSVFIPTERILLPVLSISIMGLINNNVALPRFITAFGTKYEFARKSSDGLAIDYLDLEYRFRGEEYLVKNGIPIKLSESASGYQAIIPLKIVVENYLPNREKVFIIEEPELNLYPTTQKSLIYYLADRCTKGENELMMTTHSPYVLAALNNLIFAHKVAHEKPELAPEVEQVIPRASWLNPDDFAAYFVADGTVRSIINPKTGLISENELDSVSDEIGDEFDSLMDLYRRKKNETVH